MTTALVNPLSKKTVADVLALARLVSVPIYVIGLGTELDEINLEKGRHRIPALSTSTPLDPADLKRLYDSIGKQLAGQYTIYYTSNLPSDGSEHRVQLKFGAVTSTKSFVRPARFAAVRPAAPAPAAKPAEPPADLPNWLPLYPGAKPQGLSIATDPQTGKRAGSYFFRTSDEIKQVHDFYEDTMTRATWHVSRAPTQVWGNSKAEGRKFEVSSERRGDDTRVRVTFEEKKAGVAAAGGE